MKRVVITGMGIISSIGNNKEEVLNSLYHGLSGIVYSEEMKKINMRSNIWGNIKLNDICMLTKKIDRFMNNAARYSFLTMLEAIKDANISDQRYQKNPRVGIITGSGCSCLSYFLCDNKSNIKNEYISKITSPYFTIQTMPSVISACLSVLFKIYGVNYSISSACATSAHCIGNAFELIQFGKQDLIFAGGAEEVSLELARHFDTMRVLSTHFNKFPQKASRVYDINRDGFVISGGAGIVVMEELTYALSRGAHIYAEIIGYAATSDGSNMVVPSGDGAFRCMNLARNKKKISVDYINVHGTSTKIGDIIELKAIKKIFFNEKKPMISATKSMTGHALGASGVHEIIYTLLMMQNNFIAPTINIERLDPNAENMNIIQKTKNIKITTAMSNSFGFGGTNTSLIIKKY
ncbi:beta-ketoacyl-[acyl-carrier-protein] synthase I [Buchnera aphidicola (Macrosiphoniella sanborni)]|uniref:3-oxoacyl-[acyl-carrier-protein] synthase 1 n=1 Tax=Buchnera aphidicola (Macrosiphoniella sanborni) TaxID=1241865 RepID=A0A4D6YC89_9GAMM|nr:beta-ketoacyl synthase N-terminal-like domain-containing protein [Buchnera aphidicola]QCI23658.1 beta-ketoacyl-[acyl-carrier-protein] synthase I [Buchnera aphidicola (Macrosiphoniella sanborni)]